MVSRSHERCPTLSLDDLGNSLTIFKPRTNWHFLACSASCTTSRSPLDLEESASHPLPLPEGVPQVFVAWQISWFSCLETVKQGPEDLSESILLCWRTMMISQYLVEQASVGEEWIVEQFLYCRRIIPVKAQLAGVCVHNNVWVNHFWLLSALDLSIRLGWDLVDPKNIDVSWFPPSEVSVHALGAELCLRQSSYHECSFSRFHEYHDFHV